MELTKAQQVMVDAIANGDILGKHDVHPATANSLEGKGIIEWVGDYYAFTTEGYELFGNPVAEETAIDVEDIADEVPEEVEVSTDDEGTSTILMVQLGAQVKIQVSAKGDLALLPVGSMHPVISFHEEVTGGRHPKHIEWYTCLHMPTKTTFLLNLASHTLKEVEVAPEEVEDVADLPLTESDEL